MGAKVCWTPEERVDDVPTQITETVIDDIMTDVNVLRMEDERVEACFIWESTGIASCIQVRKEGNPPDHENTTVH